MDRVKTNPNVVKALKKLPENNKESVKLRSPKTPRISAGDCVTFLGTGASSPSKFRNVSAILLQTASGGNVMLDCGEGTLAQLYCHFGPTEGDSVLENLKVIFISHIHGDHSLGVISLLHKRGEILQRITAATSDRSKQQAPTYVIGPSNVHLWLRNYSQRCQKLHYHFILSGSLTEGESAVGLVRTLAFQTVPVFHIKDSHGVVVSHRKGGWRVVYSGDTRPCPELVEAGRGATLLLHEATLEDGMVEEARTEETLHD